jgi:hypothetical protein
LVTYTSKNIENNENESAMTEEKEKLSKEKSSEEKPPEENSSSKVISSGESSNVVTKTFWTVIGLGPSIKAPSGTSGAMVTGPRSEPSGSKGPTSRGSSSSNSVRSKS